MFAGTQNTSTTLDPFYAPTFSALGVRIVSGAGGGGAEVWATDELATTATDGGAVRYRGTPKLTAGGGVRPAA